MSPSLSQKGRQDGTVPLRKASVCIVNRGWSGICYVYRTRDVGGAEERLSQWAVSLAELIGAENEAGLLRLSGFG